MKKTLISLLLFFNIFCYSQIQAVTEDGKEVVLFDNSTWKFKNDSDAKSLETIIENPNPFSKDKDATFLLKSSKLNYGIYINPKIWRPSPYATGIIEYRFSNEKIEGYALMGTEKINIESLKNFKNVLILSIGKAADYFKLKESEYRTVNGKKLLFMRYIANIKGIDFEYMGYYMMNENGTGSLICYSPQKNFEANYKAFESFLNGFVETDFSTKTEEKMYTSPPPPMKK